MSPPIRVLFVCTANACRSQMAEAILRHLGGDRFEVASAGVRPIDHVHPLAIAAIESMGLSADGQYSKGVEKVADVEFDVIVTVCDSAACLLTTDWPGRPVFVHWSLADPVTHPGLETERIAMAHDTAGRLKRMLKAFVAVRFDELSPSQIRDQLLRIGQV